MPVSKYRSISELGPPPVSESPTENIRIACELSELCYRLRPWPIPRGVHKYRSLEAAAEARERAHRQA